MHLLCQDCWAINEGNLFSEAATWLFKDCVMCSSVHVCVYVCMRALLFKFLSRTRCLGVCVALYMCVCEL